MKRWEAERGLPVHRLPGDSRSRIYALASELDAWLKGISAEPVPLASTRPARRRGAWAISVVLVFIAAVIGVTTLTLSPLGIATGRAHALAPGSVERPSAAPPPVAAQRLYVEATEAWEKRTPASLNEALVKFNAAIGLDADYAEAYAGLAKTYLLLREYTVLPDSQAYGLAESAAKRAVELNDRLPEAHAELGFVAANWLWDAGQSEREYRRAIALDPRNATIHHWFATSLASQGRLSEALAQINIAGALEPGSVTIRADRGLILDFSGDRRGAVDALSRLEADAPDFKSPHDYLARIWLEEGRDGAFFDESGRAARLSGDLPRQAIIEAGERGLASGGHRAALLAMREVELRQLQYGYGPAFAVAQTDAVLGDDAESCRYLELSRRRHEPTFVEVTGSPFFARLRRAPGDCDAIRKSQHA